MTPNAIIQMIIDKDTKRADVARVYEEMLDGVPPFHELSRVNAAIIDRWSVSALKWIKARAWDIVQGRGSFVFGKWEKKA